MPACEPHPSPPVRRTERTPPRLDVLRFGAVADGADLQTTALQAALDACPPGGAVVLPPGTYRSGALFMRRGGVTLELSEGSRLLGSDDPADYPVIRSRFEGLERDCFASLITIGSLDDAFEDIAVVGAGVIDGSGTILRKRELTVGGDQVARGRVICAMNVTGLLLQGVTVCHSPAWCVHPIYCRNVTMRNLTVNTALDENGNEYRDIWNGDGIDPDSCEDVDIIGCHIISEDDGIAIKSGRDAEGRRVGRPCRRVRISHCRFERGFGVAIGSEMSGGVEDVLVEACIFRQTAAVVTVKTRRGRGGWVRRCRFRNLDFSDARYVETEWFHGPICLDMAYGQMEPTDVLSPEPVNEGTPRIADFDFDHIRIVNRLGGAIFIRGLPEAPIENVRMQGVSANAAEGGRVAHVRGWSIENGAMDAPAPAWRLHDADGVVMRALSATAPGEPEPPPLDGVDRVMNGCFAQGLAEWQAEGVSLDASTCDAGEEAVLRMAYDGWVRQTVSAGLAAGSACELRVQGRAGRDFRFPAFGAKVSFLDAGDGVVGTLAIRQIGRLGAFQHTRGTIPPETVRAEVLVSGEGALSGVALRIAETGPSHAALAMEQTSRCEHSDKED